jgi:hypothetical protein
MKWPWNRKPEPKPDADFWYLPKDAPMPPCSFGCDRRVLHDVIVGGEKRDLAFSSLFACEHQEQALRRLEFDSQYVQTWNPTTQEFDIYPRR